MFRVLIPSLCITNPLTLSVSPSFWVIRSFPIPLETIKRGGNFYFDLYKVSSIQWLSLEHFYRYRKMATSLGTGSPLAGPSLSGLSLSLLISVYVLLLFMCYILYICLSGFS